MESRQCKIVSFLLTTLYRLTALAGLLTIFATSDAKLSSIIIFSALMLFSLSHYVESYMCRQYLQKSKAAKPEHTAEYQGMVRHLSQNPGRDIDY